jgi:hypothetical protein
MELQPARNAPRLLCGIPLVERPELVDVQIVQHDADLLGVRVVFLDQEIWSEVVYGEDEAGGVSLVDLNTTNPERMDTPCTRIRESRSDIQR